MSSSGNILREARLRAGLSQGELGERTGKDRAQIARWERDAVSPPFETLRMLVRACGFDLCTELHNFDPSPSERLETVRTMTPSERVDRMLDRRTRGEA